MKLPEGMTRGTFDMATTDGLRERPAYLIGSFAVHGSSGAWTISHAATGISLPRAHAETLAEAAELARHLEKVLDWSRVRRGREFPKVAGWRRSKMLAVKAALDAWGLHV